MSATPSTTPAASAQPSQPTVIVQQPRRRRTGLWIVFLLLVICSLCGLISLVLAYASSSSTTSEKGVDDLTYTYVYGDKNANDKLVVMYIDQEILSAAQDYSNDLVTALVNGQYVYGYQIKDQLMKLVDDPEVKGVMLYINSPGGTVVGAQAISDGVAYYRSKTGKPVYAYVQDLAASGAYWSAVSADQIYAEPGSLVGSIGVIMGPFEYYDNLISINGAAANKISYTYITGGISKDLGNPTRKLTKNELQVLQNGVNQTYTRFVNYVSTRRNIPTDAIRSTLKALIYDADTAKSYHMIDQIGNRDQAYLALATKAGIADNYQVVKIQESSTGLFSALFGSLVKSNLINQASQTQKTTTNTCVLCGKMLFYYGDPTKSN